MKFMRKSWKALAVGIVGIGIVAAGAAPASAFSGSESRTLPGTSIKLQANAWSQSISRGGFDWATSSKATQGGSSRSVDRIKNTAKLEVRGVNVSISTGGISGTGGVVASATLDWTNYNSWISDLSGYADATGLTVSYHANSAAFAFHDGVKVSVSAWSW